MEGRGRSAPSALFALALLALLTLPSCGVVGVVTTGAMITGAVVKTGYTVTKGAAKLTWGAGKLLVKAVMAPMDWPLTRDEIDTIDGLSPKEAIERGLVKNAPYTVRGKRYLPMSVAAARTYRQRGTASWYGDETYRMKDGHMTANGEAFHPDGISAAHKYLPLPTFVRVTRISTGKSIIVRVNDRGPFIPGRIIDLSAGAAKKLGFIDEGTAEVLVETVELDD